MTTTKKRGRRDEPFSCPLRDVGQDAETQIEELKGELESWRDSIEEHFSETPKYAEVSECCDALESCESSAGELTEAITEAPEDLQSRVVNYTQDTRASSTSRADRLDDVRRMVEALAEDLREVIDANEAMKEKLGTAYVEAAEAIELAATNLVSEFDSVSFPGMY